MNPDTVDVDATSFRKLAESVNKGEDASVAALLEAEELYAGDLLEGFDDEWIQSERTHFRMLYVNVLHKLVQCLRSESEYSRAIHFAQKLLSIEPLDELCHRDLMLLLYLAGNRTAALSQYEKLRDLLRAELGVPPEESTTELWKYVRSQSGPHRGAALPSHADNLADLPGAANRIPMVGRQEELSLLTEGLENCIRGRGSCFIVTGEPGIGKTRLVQALSTEAKLRRFAVLTGRCADISDPPPYQAFIEALWPRISAKAQGETVPFIEQLLKRLSPSTAVASDDTSVLHEARAVLNEMLLRLLDSDDPTLLILEDFHRSDRATEELVSNAITRFTDRRLMLVLTGRAPDELGTLENWTLADGSARVLSLKRLTGQETRNLVESLLQSRSIIPSAFEYVETRSAGNPLAVIEFVKFLIERNYLVRGPHNYWSWNSKQMAHLASQLPRRIHDLVARRIAGLDKATADVLKAAAVLGSEADDSLLERLSGLDRDRFTERVDALVRVGLLEETGIGYRFQHESYRIVALSKMSQAMRRLLHLRVAEIIENASPGRVEDLAWHFSEGRNDVKTLKYCEASGDKARSVHANADAQKWYTRALDVLPAVFGGTEASERELSLRLKRQEVLDLLGKRREQLSDIEAVEKLAPKAGKEELLAQALHLKAKLLGRMNMNREALQAAQDAARLFGRVGDVNGEACAHESAALVYVNQRAQSRSEREFRRALVLFRQARNKQGEARSLAGIGAVLSFAGRNVEGLALLQKGESLLAKSDDRRSYAWALTQEGVVLRFLGNARRSERVLNSGVELMRRIGDRVGEARGFAQLAYTHTVQGRFREALLEVRNALRLAQETGDTRALIIFLNNAAYGAFRHLGDFERAERSVRMVLSLVRNSDTGESTAMYEDTMASILLDKGEYKAANEWATEAFRHYGKSLPQLHYVLEETALHLGEAALRLGRLKEARGHLERAVSRWTESKDTSLLPQAIALLGELDVQEGRIESGLDRVRKAGRLAARYDGVEQPHRVYWSQYLVCTVAGRRAEARNALKRAFDVVESRAAPLKGRFRRKFLAILLNRRIVAEFAKLGDAAKLTVEPPRIAEPATSVAEMATRLRRRPIAIQERRELILKLVQGAVSSPKAIAGRLGVSERTVRNDMAALRRQGLMLERHNQTSGSDGSVADQRH